VAVRSSLAGVRAPPLLPATRSVGDWRCHAGARTAMATAASRSRDSVRSGVAVRYAGTSPSPDGLRRPGAF
jgi:hypothetical protein